MSARARRDPFDSEETIRGTVSQLLKLLAECQSRAMDEGNETANDAWREAFDLMQQTMIAVTRARKAEQ